MPVAVKAASMHTILLESSLSYVYMCLNGSRLQQTHKLLTFDFKGTGVGCIDCSSKDYPMNFILMGNVAK